MHFVANMFFSDHYKDMLPPHSYIQVEDFPSINILADYLKHLDQNPAEYLSYFWWRDHYQLQGRSMSIKRAMCELCPMLNDENQPVKVVEDLEDWWWTQSQCRRFPEWK